MSASPKKMTEAEKKQHELKKNVSLTEHKEELGDLMSRLNTTLESGLSGSQVTELQAKWGPNMLTPPKETPLWLMFIQELTGFFSLLLWFGGILCFVAFYLKEEMDNLYLGIVLCLVVLITGIFSFFQNKKSTDLMKSFANMLPPKVMVLRDGKKNFEDAKKLVPGDIVEVNAGDLIPADLRVLECSDNLQVDNSSLTGESEPQKRKNVCTNDDPLETQNLCFFGTQVPEGSMTAVVISTGDHTVMGRIAALAMQTKNDQTPINKEIHHFIHIISAIAIFLGVSFLIVNALKGADLTTNLVFMIGIIVANVPEGLIVTVTVCLTLTAGRMHTKMVLVKNLEGVETLGSTSCICSDKTGTLTQNIMTVARIVYGGKDGFTIEDCESSFAKKGSTFDAECASFKALAKCATLCNVCSFDEKSKYVCDDNNEFILDSSGNKQPVDFFRMREQGDGSTIKEVAWKPIGNASEAAMIKFIHPISDVDKCRATAPAETVIPFNSKNKYQVHVHVQEEFNTGEHKTEEDIIANNKGNRMVYMKGAPERILDRCDKQLIDGVIKPLNDADKKKIEDLNIRLAEDGLRVLAFCQAELETKDFKPGYKYEADPDGYCSPNFPIGDMNTKYDSSDPVHPQAKVGMVYIGMMALIDPPRPAVPGAVNKCKTAGIKVVMVTGDHPVTAQAIAYKVGILWSKTQGDMEKENDRDGLSPGDEGWQDPADAQAIVVPGHKISVDMEVEKWDAILEHPQIVFARTSPQQKLIIVENCQRLGHIVAVTGDGVNDSPALKKADIGVAMGIMGSEVSKNAADMILLDDNFASIVAGVEEGRLIFDNLKKSICYTLTSNIPEISPFLSFIVFSIPLPLSTVLILGIDLGTDMVPAISMAYEKSEADIMKRPPRNAKIDRLVTKKLIHLAYFQIGIMQAMSGFYVYMLVLNDYGFPPHILQGLGVGDYWGKQALYCRFQGGQFVDKFGNIKTDTTYDSAGVITSAPDRDHPFWDRGDGGYVIDCEYPVKNFRGVDGTPSNFQRLDSSTYDGKTKGWSIISAESIEAIEADNYYEYVAWRSKMSPFFKTNWLNWDVNEYEGVGGSLGDSNEISWFNAQPVGMYSLCLGNAEAKTLGTPYDSDYGGFSVLAAGEAKDVLGRWNPGTSALCDSSITSIGSDKLYDGAKFCNGMEGEVGCDLLTNNVHMPRWCSDCSDTSTCGAASTTRNKTCLNIASRMSQKEALHHAQGSYFISIIVVQWADLLICKTRWLSLRTQGLSNSVMNFGLFFETLLGAYLCYVPAFNTALGTRDIRFTHWLPGIPWSILIFTYDETRKYLMRTTSPETVDQATGQVKRIKGWLEVNTYY